MTSYRAKLTAEERKSSWPISRSAVTGTVAGSRSQVEQSSAIPWMWMPKAIRALHGDGRGSLRGFMDDLARIRSGGVCLCFLFIATSSSLGGDDGGWAEGNAYWRGTSNTLNFKTRFWPSATRWLFVTVLENSPYFALYNLQALLHTTLATRPMPVTST